jgi:arsenite methyltransferase
MSSHETETMRATINSHYAEIARATLAGPEEASQGGCCAPTSGCGSVAFDAATRATSIGYAASDLSTLPAGANMGLSCGNPTALA